MIAHVLVEIDDRAVLRGHVALYEDERAFGMGEVEHVVLLREDRFVVGLDRYGVFQIHSVGVFRRRSDQERTPCDVEIGRPACRCRCHFDRGNPSFGRQCIRFRSAVFHTNGFVRILQPLNFEAASVALGNLGRQAVDTARFEIASGFGLGIDAAVGEGVGYVYFLCAAIRRIDDRCGEYARGAARRGQFDTLLAERKRYGVVRIGRIAESGAVEGARTGQYGRGVGRCQRDGNELLLHVLRPGVEPDVSGGVREGESSFGVGRGIAEIAVRSELQFARLRLALFGRNDGFGVGAGHVVINPVGCIPREVRESEVGDIAVRSRFGALYAACPDSVAGAPLKLNFGPVARHELSAARGAGNTREGYLPSGLGTDFGKFLDVRGAGRQAESCEDV